MSDPNHTEPNLEPAKNASSEAADTVRVEAATKTSAASEENVYQGEEPPRRSLKIDVDSVLRTRAAKAYKFLPKALIHSLERFIRQDQLNEMLDYCGDRRDAEFCRGVLDNLQIQVDVRAPYGWPDKENPRVIIVSNHPLGGLDGIAIIDFFTRYYGCNIKFVVNDLLMAVEPLQGVFLPINKHGAQSRDSLRAIDEAMASDMPVIIFPAGLVSRKGKDGEIRDLDWKKMFLAKARKFNRQIIPIFFHGENSRKFYSMAQWRKRLHIGFNLEMTRLPAEIFLSKGKRFAITIGKPIEQSLIDDKTLKDEQKVEKIKDITYQLSQL